MTVQFLIYVTAAQWGCARPRRRTNRCPVTIRSAVITHEWATRVTRRYRGYRGLPCGPEWRDPIQRHGITVARSHDCARDRDSAPWICATARLGAVRVLRTISTAVVGRARAASCAYRRQRLRRSLYSRDEKSYRSRSLTLADRAISALSHFKRALDSAASISIETIIAKDCHVHRDDQREMRPVLRTMFREGEIPRGGRRSRFAGVVIATI